MTYSGGDKAKGDAQSSDHPQGDSRKQPVARPPDPREDDASGGQAAGVNGNGNGAIHCFDAFKDTTCCRLKEKYGNCSREDIEDAWQEACRKLHEKLQEDAHYLVHKTPAAWLFTTARRNLQTLLRKMGRDDRRIEGKIDILLRAGSCWEALDAIEKQELQESVLRVYEELNPFEQFVWDFYVEHYPDSRRAAYLAKVTGVDSLFETSSKSQATKTRRLLNEMVSRIRRKFLDDLENGGFDNVTK